jgi:L-lactate dehydrogenase complex protein LldF
VLLLDNGRTAMLGNEFREMLRCIRCGACINHCPIYGAIGGHAYGWVYSGPMGAVLIPNLIGLPEAGHLPNASTLCGRCEEVCPMRIPLPRMLRQLRQRQFEAKLSAKPVRWGLAGWALLARRAALYRLATRIGVGALGLLGRRRGRFRALPLASGWTNARDLPAPQGRTFQQMWSAKAGRRV